MEKSKGYIKYFLLLLTVFAFFFFGPTFEEVYFPVLTNMKISNIVRTKDNVCWTFEFDKVRAISPEYSVYTIKGEHLTYTVDLLKDDQHKNVFTIKDNPVSEGITRKLCIKIPENIEKNAIITGETLYRPHLLWPIFQRIPEIKIPNTIAVKTKHHKIHVDNRVTKNFHHFYRRHYVHHYHSNPIISGVKKLLSVFKLKFTR